MKREDGDGSCDIKREPWQLATNGDDMLGMLDLVVTIDDYMETGVEPSESAPSATDGNAPQHHTVPNATDGHAPQQHTVPNSTDSNAPQQLAPASAAPPKAPLIQTVCVFR